MKKLDLTNEKFNSLKVLKQSDRVGKNIYWVCLCDCGKITEVSSSNVRLGKVKSCGCSKRLNIKGKIFGQLQVLEFSEVRNKTIYWECLCECGETCVVETRNLVSGKTKSCGCFMKQVNRVRMTTHGESYTNEYKNFHTRLRQARKLKATPCWAELKSIKQFYKNCPKGYHVDHIVPLKGKNVCGLHVIANLQYLTKEENLSKGNKFNN